jgi:hypothetical protein
VPRRFTAALAALLLAGCSAPDIDLEIDPAFSPEDATAIRAAAGQWNVVTREGGRKFHVVPRGDVLVLSAHCPNNDGGLEQGRFDIVRIDPDAPRKDVYALALHELGHALEIRHTKTGVMAERILDTEFTPEVIKACKRAGACN